VDLEAGIVRLEPGTTKSREGRLFPLAAVDELRLMLESQKAHTDALAKAEGKIIPWVFHRGGEQVRSLRKAWKSACKAAGCPGRLCRMISDARPCATSYARVCRRRPRCS
jgi:hypothetical protein